MADVGSAGDRRNLQCHSTAGEQAMVGDRLAARYSAPVT